MIWNSQTVLVNWGYKPVTKPAIFWHQTADGEWRGCDRGAGEDTYEAIVVFDGSAAELTTLEEEVTAKKRQAFNITCGTGEEIFGADVDYSGALSVTFVDYGRLQRVGYDRYTYEFKLALPSPTFVSTSPSLSGLRLSHQYTGYSEFDIIKQRFFDGSFDYRDHDTDPGVFEAVFTQTQSEMEAIRRYLSVTARNNAVAFPSMGETYPFGRVAGDGPFNVKITEWEDLGRQDLINWQIRIKFTRAF